MPTIVKVKELAVRYQSALAPYPAATITAATALDLALRLYEELKIKGVATTDPDCDMLLFQYGTYDWGEPRGRHFSFDITRQFEREESGQLYQLAFTLYFAAAPFADCPSFNSWSSDAPTMAAWREQVRATPGFQLAQTQIPKAVASKLDKV